VTIARDDDEGRERLCRYAARPAFALARLTGLPDGRIAYRVRWSRSPSGPFRVMTPLEFMARLAAIVPPPRYPLVRYHGVLAPASRWRRLVVPRPREPPRACTSSGSTSGERAREEAASAPAGERGVVTGLSVGVPSPDGLDEPHETVITAAHWNRVMDGALLARGPRIEWAVLLRRTFGVDALACPVCAGRMRVLELVTEPAKAQALLDELGIDGSSTERPGRAGESIRRGSHVQARAP